MGHTLTAINRGTGAVKLHKAGCKDLARLASGSSVWDLEVETVKDVVLNVYPPDDFQYDPETGWRDFNDVDFMKCCPDLPDEPAEIAEEAPATPTRTRATHHTHKACGHELTPLARAACRASHTWDGTAWVPQATD